MLTVNNLSKFKPITARAHIAAAHIYNAKAAMNSALKKLPLNKNHPEIMMTEQPIKPSLATQIFSRNMLICVFTGFSSGLPLFVLLQMLPIWLSDNGISVQTIGAFTLVTLPYTLKFCGRPCWIAIFLDFSVAVAVGSPFPKSCFCWVFTWSVYTIRKNKCRLSFFWPRSSPLCPPPKTLYWCLSTGNFAR